MEGGYLIVVSTRKQTAFSWMEQSKLWEETGAELLDQYIGEIAYNKYLMNGSEKNEQIGRYSLYALVLSKLFGTDRIYKNSP